MPGDTGAKPPMSDDRIQALIAEYASTYPPLLTAEQAAEIAGVSVGTIHNWSCDGRLNGCKATFGRLRIHRDAFVRLIATGHLPQGRGK